MDVFSVVCAGAVITTSARQRAVVNSSLLILGWLSTSEVRLNMPSDTAERISKKVAALRNAVMVSSEGAASIEAIGETTKESSGAKVVSRSRRLGIPRVNFDKETAKSAAWRLSDPGGVVSAWQNLPYCLGGFQSDPPWICKGC